MAILGIDEVGRGPLAGPLVVGAVILPEGGGSGGVGEPSIDADRSSIGVDRSSIGADGRPEWVADLRDSKKLSAKKRAVLEKVILAEAPATGLGFVTPVEIDELGMGQALCLATRRAVEEVRGCIARKRVAGEAVGFDQIVIDGKVNFLKGTKLEGHVSTAVKADDLVKEVSAASIIAKQARDRYMIGVGERYPGYGFEKHMGYGTAAHMEALRRYGVTPEHRRSFAPVAEMVGFSREKVGVGGECVGDWPQSSDRIAKGWKDTTGIGARGEAAVCEYLRGLGHEVAKRNFKTYYYEIDIVSVREGRMYFTEVKTRQDAVRGGGLAAVDGRKLKQMRYAAECYLGYRGLRCDASLAVAAVKYDAATGECEVEDWVELA